MFGSLQSVVACGSFPERLAKPCRKIRLPKGNQLGPNMHRRFETSVKKGGEQTGPSPVDRGKSGTNLHLATDGRGMPLGAVITGANENDGQQTANVLDALVIKPPLPQVMNHSPDPRDLPSVHGDGAYGNEPSCRRAQDSGFRMRAPRRGQTRIPGIGRIRSAVERGHALLCQFGRVTRRLDRHSAHYLGWVQLAACVIFIRAGFFR